MSVFLLLFGSVLGSVAYSPYLRLVENKVEVGLLSLAVITYLTSILGGVGQAFFDLSGFGVVSATHFSSAVWYCASSCCIGWSFFNLGFDHREYYGQSDFAEHAR